MSQSVRIVQLADLHFGDEDPGALGLAAGYIADDPPDAVLVAGDLTQHGWRAEFDAAERWLRGLPCPVYAVPGNHDTPWLDLYTRAVAPFRRFRRAMTSIDLTGELITLGDGRVRVAGINTARGIQLRLNWALGGVDLGELDEALAALGGGSPMAWRLLLCHHPLVEPVGAPIPMNTRRGPEALERSGAAGVDAILTGHLHEPFIEAQPTHRRPIVQMGCGTLSRRLRSPYPGFAELSLTEDRLTRDILSIEGDRLVATRHYDWSME